MPSMFDFHPSNCCTRAAGRSADTLVKAYLERLDIIDSLKDNINRLLLYSNPIICA
jgi:hypothetical protein